MSAAPSTEHETFWESILRLASDKRFLIPTSMLPITTIWLLVLAARHANQESFVAKEAALATLQFALLWAVALSGFFLLWLAGARALLGAGMELSQSLVLSGGGAGALYLIAAVSLIWSC